MSFFGGLFGKNKSPPPRKREPTPVDPPQIDNSSAQKKGGLFKGLEIKNNATKPPAPAGRPGMFSGLSLNDGKATAAGNKSNPVDADDAGGMSAFGFLDEGGEDDGAEAFGFLDGNDETDGNHEAGNFGGAAEVVEQDQEGAAGVGEGEDGSAFAFLGGEKKTAEKPEGEIAATITSGPSTAAPAAPETAAGSSRKIGEEEEAPPQISTKAEVKQKMEEEGKERPPTKVGAMFAGLKVGGDDEEEEGELGDGAIIPATTTVEAATLETDERKRSPNVKEMVRGNNIEKGLKAGGGDRLASEPPVRAKNPSSAEVERLSANERAIRDAEKELAGMLGILCGAREKFFRDRHELETTVQGAMERIAEAEAKRVAASKAVEAAIEAEDYEAADAHTKEIDELKAEVLRLQKKSRQATRNRAALESEKARSIAATLDGLKGVSENFARLAGERREEKAAYVNKTTANLQRQEDRACGELERVERRLGHTEVDRKHVDEEEADIQGAIDRETSDVSARRSKLEGEAIELEMEVEGLRAKLAEREASLRKCRGAIDVCDEQIGEAKKGYDRQLARIAEKRDSILKDQREAEGEKQNLLQQIEAMKQKSADLKEKESDYEASIEELSACAQGIGQLIQSLAQEKKIVESLGGRETEETQDPKSPDSSEVSSSKGSASQLQEQIAALGVDIQNIIALTHHKEEEEFEHQELMKKIELDLPVLENRKKTAVKRRAFKDAARVAAEIKSLAVKKDDAVKAVEEASQEISRLKKDLEAKTEQKQSIEDKLTEAMSKEDEARLEVVESLLKINREQAKCGSLLPEAVRDTHQTVLSEEKDVLENEAKALRKRHGWPDDFKRMVSDLDVNDTGGGESEEAGTKEASSGREQVEEILRLRGEIKNLSEEIEKREKKIEEVVELEKYEVASELEELNEKEKKGLAELQEKLTTLEASAQGLEGSLLMSGEPEEELEVAECAEISTSEETPMSDDSARVGAPVTRTAEIVGAVDVNEDGKVFAQPQSMSLNPAEKEANEVKSGKLNTDSQNTDARAGEVDDADVDNGREVQIEVADAKEFAGRDESLKAHTDDEVGTEADTENDAGDAETNATESIVDE
mmetsp:Transcript_4783/g.11330  ORF Transcript_4783/g.11330 Transcript_4783/m.11330 type:complete len:1103 (-) Transcript_4783:292-3600(-)